VRYPTTKEQRLFGLLLVMAAALASLPVAADAPAHTHLISVRYKTWIWQKPHKGGRYLGYMRVGQRLRLMSPDKVVGRGCSAGFFRVAPRGFVCHDRTVAFAETAFLRANAHTAAAGGAHPYHYALSNNAPMYARVPTAREQKRSEWPFGKAGAYKRLSMFQRGHEQLAVDRPIPATDPMPAFLLDGGTARGHVFEVVRRTIPLGSMLAYTKAFDVDGRTFLLSTDLTLVPADRVRPFRRSAFHGVQLGGDGTGSGVTLPIAWFRARPRPQYRRTDDGEMARTGELFDVRSHVPLTGGRVEHDGRTYLEVKSLGVKNGDGLYTDAADATVVERREKRPYGIAPGRKWIIVSIMQGTLVAYDDMTPVFSTLMSPGLNGIPRRGGDPVKDSTTPLGTFSVTFKDRAATMSPEQGENRKFWIADVPFTQYFNAPFALHGAYWHESFGEPMSAGCVNVSPIDAEWLFGWTDPQVPEGWQGAVGSSRTPENGPTTGFVVTR